MQQSIFQFFALLLLSFNLVSCGGSDGQSNDGAIQIQQGPNNFTNLFSKTVSHPRCVNCHAFAEGGQSARQHRGRSRDCSSCHDQEDWRESTPNMTFTNRSASQICNTSARRRGGVNAVATLLRTSPHVLWGVRDGDIPSSNARLPLAPPQNGQSWQELINRWVAAGSSCE